jgi:hypothetical protein
VLVAIGLAMAASVRIGAFLVFFVLYVGGYPAIQFDVRHYFHLEFITWWAAGFVLQTAIVQVRTFVRERRWDSAWTPALKRASYGLAASALALGTGLWAARAYQQASARAIFGAYLEAESDDIDLPRQEPGVLVAIARGVPATDPETAELLRIDVNDWQCSEHEALTFRYDPGRHQEFWRTVFLNDRQPLRAPTHIFMPVYDGFQGIERATANPGCITRIAHVRNPGRFALLLEAVLPPQWETRPLYQRLGAVGPPQMDGAP